MTDTTTPPVLLIHGLWMTPLSWHTWAGRFRDAGHEVIVPGWPGIDDRSVADIRRDPSALRASASDRSSTTTTRSSGHSR